MYLAAIRGKGSSSAFKVKSVAHNELAQRVLCLHRVLCNHPMLDEHQMIKLPFLGHFSRFSYCVSLCSIALCFILLYFIVFETDFNLNVSILPKSPPHPHACRCIVVHYNQREFCPFCLFLSYLYFVFLSICLFFPTLLLTRTYILKVRGLRVQFVGLG